MKQQKVTENKKDWYNIIFTAVIVLCIVACVAFVGFMIYDGISKTKETMSKADEITTSTVELVSIQYQNEQTGSFYLGFGNVSDTDYYVCYKVREDGGKELVKFKVEDTIIYDILAADEMAYAEVSVNGYGYTKEVKLYVPKDTIQVNYDFNVGE